MREKLDALYLSISLEALYLDYCNSFLTLDCFAEYYNITIEKADRIIDIGRKLNHRRAQCTDKAI